MSKYKAGDKVRIRKDLKVGECYGELSFIGGMDRCKGHIGTIRCVIGPDCYKITDIAYSFSDKMLEPIEDKTTIHAHDLMKLAAENPKEYEGRRYRVVEGVLIGVDGNKHENCFVQNRSLTSLKGNLRLYASDMTILKEIQPEPVYVPFMDAVKAFSEGKTVECEVGGAKHVICCRDSNDTSFYATTDAILHGKWRIF